MAHRQEEVFHITKGKRGNADEARGEHFLCNHLLSTMK